MNTIPVSTVIDTIVALFSEAYAGPANPSETWFIDNQPDSGILGVLEGVSAAEASWSVDVSGQAGSTIAANAEHLRWSLANASGAMRGEPYNPDWSESWNTVNLDEPAWDRLRQSLRTEFETLRETIKQQQELPGVFLPGVLALIPHAAYHLGTIRQMIERVRSAQHG